MNNTRLLPPEWHPQSAVQLTWPHAGTDWAYMLPEVELCFTNIAREIAARQLLVVACNDKNRVTTLLQNCHMENIRLVEVDADDTWARDHGGITVLEGEKPILLDFGFNGWGNKFEAKKDNLITSQMYQAGVFAEQVNYQNCLNFILEGGSIESDGRGTLLTTSACLLTDSRNPTFSQTQIADHLQSTLGAKQILWLDHGYLSGDDTDSHIDTLARFCDENTIAYVACDDESDEHFAALKKMKNQLATFRTPEGNPYRLIALPMADAVYDNGERLPATYANFLIINDAVLVPFYDSKKDQQAQEILQEVFPDREIIGINCLPLIKQHGSLHCVTMQYPAGAIR